MPRIPFVASRPSKLNEEQVRQIKRLLIDGARTIDVAARFGISSGMVRTIKRGDCWGWVTAAEPWEVTP